MISVIIIIIIVHPYSASLSMSLVLSPASEVKVTGRICNFKKEKPPSDDLRQEQRQPSPAMAQSAAVALAHSADPGVPGIRSPRWVQKHGLAITNSKQKEATLKEDVSCRIPNGVLRVVAVPFVSSMI